MRTMTVNGVEYETFTQLEVRFEADRMTIHAVPARRVVRDRCEHCGRFELEDVVAHSWEECETFGWVRRINLEAP